MTQESRIIAVDLNRVDLTSLVEEVAKRHFESRGGDFADLTATQQFLIKESMTSITTTVLDTLKAQA